MCEHIRVFFLPFFFFYWSPRSAKQTRLQLAKCQLVTDYSQGGHASR